MAVRRAFRTGLVALVAAVGWPLLAAEPAPEGRWEPGVELKLPAKFEPRVQALSADGQLIAVGGHELAPAGTPETAVVLLFDCRSGQLKSRWSLGPGKTVHRLQFTADGKRLGIGTGGLFVLPNQLNRSWSLEVWDVAMQRQLHRLTLRWQALLPMAENWSFSPDGKLLAVSELEQGVKIYDGQNYRLRDQLNAAKAHTVAWSPDGKRLVTAMGNRVKLWDSTTLKEVAAFDGPGLVETNCISWSPDGKNLVLASTWTRTDLFDMAIPIRAWDVAGRKEIELPGGKVRSCCKPVYSPDGSSLILLETKHPFLKKDDAPVPPLGQGVPGLAGMAIIGVDGKSFVHIRDTGTGKEKQMLEVGGKADSLALAADGQTLAVMRRGESSYVWPVNPPPANPFVSSVRGAVKLWHYRYVSPGQPEKAGP